MAQTMGEATRSVLSNYATFTGRASRSDYWWWLLAYFLALLALGLVDSFIVGPALGFESGDENAGQPLSMLFVLGLFVPNIALGVRRLHDLNKPGWWLALAFLPFIGALVLIYWFIQPGTHGANDFEAEPKENSGRIYPKDEEAFEDEIDWSFDFSGV